MYSQERRKKRKRACRLRQIRLDYQKRVKEEQEINMTVEDIAGILGISSGSLFLYEAGRALPNALVFDDICSFFNTSLSDVYPVEEVENVQ